MTSKDLANESVRVQHSEEEPFPARTDGTTTSLGMKTSKGEQISGHTPSLYATHHYNWDDDVHGVKSFEQTQGTHSVNSSSRCSTLPVFPTLAAMGTTKPDLDALTSDLSDPQQIAKEAMRLSKQTLSRYDQKSSSERKFPPLLVATPVAHTSAITTDKVNPRNSMVLPMKLSVCGPSTRLNKFVRRLHDMLSKERDAGLVEWRRGLLVIKSTGYFAKNILPKYFNTRNFKTFRRQLNYYGFVHIRSFSNAEQSTCALWVNGELSKIASEAGVDPNDVASVLLLRRVEMADQATTNEMRRVRKELAIRTIEKDLGISTKALQLHTLTSLGSPSPSANDNSSARDVSISMSDASSETSSEKCHCLEVESVVYEPCSKPPPFTPTIMGSTVVSSDDSTDEEATVTKPPPSNASAANLLLLLSKA